MKSLDELGIVALAFNPSTWEADTGMFEFEACPLYRATLSQTKQKLKNHTKSKLWPRAQERTWALILEMSVVGPTG